MTAQTVLWTGGFGDEYRARNAATEDAIDARRRLWLEILGKLPVRPDSILEVGANIGLNLRALDMVSAAELFAVEPNEAARRELAASACLAQHNIRDGTAQSLPFRDGSVDLAFTSGVLIHIAPEGLEAACREIYRVASRYIVCIEYFSAKPEQIEYRGHLGQLFKRDFGSFWLDLYPSLRPLGCGFAWKRTTGLDNLTWWVFQK